MNKDTPVNQFMHMPPANPLGNYQAEIVNGVMFIKNNNGDIIMEGEEAETYIKTIHDELDRKAELEANMKSIVNSFTLEDWLVLRKLIDRNK